MDLTSFIFPAILLGVLLIFVAIFLIVTKNQKKKSSINKEVNVKKDSKKSSSSENKSVPKEDIFNFMEFDRIIDNMIIQKDGTKFTMAIKCKGINYDLMSDIEQIAVEQGFITFLNTLRFPIQLYVQAQNIDLKSAINTYKQNANGIREEYENINRQYTNLIEQFDSEESEIREVEEKRERVLNVYEYAEDIINYVERLSLNKNLLQRNFYVLVSYYTSEITSAEKFNKDEIINICYNELLTRAQTIISALAACSVTGEVLTSNELADLIYIAYNRDDKGFLSVKEAIQSGFYRLYSTSEDVFMKKQEKLQEQIDIEAQYRALEALKEAIKSGSYIPPEVEQMDVIDRVSKQASEIVKNEDVPDEIKEKAKKILVKEYKNEKEKILGNSKTFDKDGNLKEEKEDANTKKTESEEKKLEKEEVNKKVEDKTEEKVDTSSEVLDNRMGFEVEDTAQETKSQKEENNNSSESEDDLII